MQSLDSLIGTIPTDRLNAGLVWLQRLVRNPSNPDVALSYLRSFDSDLHVELVRKLKSDPEGRRLLQERPRLDARSLRVDELARQPSGTLGHALARYFREQHVQPFVSRAPIQDDVDYVANRLRETHDLWHVLTGYGTYPTGEVELQAFSYGNLGNLSSLVFLSYVPGVDTSKGIESLPGWLGDAYRRGRACRPLMGVHWEDHWGTPLAELREELCKPVRNEPRYDRTTP
ncbi:Coq4 family protein [Polyangium aurulentum]|uniref:Coq4 family protein n=1 Tax=Polyangium aurulentum TaxID=2567896 RepID=UPI0010AE9891|nr:Coq4 family protein [Polyangium aurulentum]UQA55971.1 ubiquinone biosynthesis protein COQ4 [Polyangium aurulentum]